MVAISSRRQFFAAATGAAILGVPIARRALAQQTPRPLSFEAKVLAAEGNTLYTATPEGPLTVKLGPSIQVWKKSIRRDFTLITPGDSIYVTGTKDAAGNLVATDVAANITSFWGMIVSVSGNQYEVLLHHPEPTGVRKFVIVDSGVLDAFDRPLSPGDIRVGRFVQTIGLVRPDGKIEATKAIVYENNMPLNTPPHLPALDPRGKVVRP